MRKIISTALFGSGDAYGQYLPALVLAHHSVFPDAEGWVLRVHVDRAVEGGRWGRFLRALAAKNLVEVEVMGDAPLCRAMLWRLNPVFGPLNNYVFCRDADSLPMPRDRAACEQFISSHCVVHSVHDNVVHRGIMGGLCGFRAVLFQYQTGLRTLSDIYGLADRAGVDWSMKGADQGVLASLLLRSGSPELFEHRFAGWSNGPRFLSERAPGSYDCPSQSAPVPDVGTSRLVPELTAQADRLAPHLGAAGFDHGAARRFYEEHGDVVITKHVNDCERSVS